MKILAIESSCDETAAAVVEGREILSSVVSTQIEEHKIYGGVVPEIASRRHAEAISVVCDEAVLKAGLEYKDIDAVAVTYAPGLIGALLVGVNFAKALALSLNKPLIPVHHLRSHIAANYLVHKDLKPPFLCLTVSGGNSILTEVKDYTDFEIIGGTTDDAAGECFDKCARALGLPYPGGVNLDKIATQPDHRKYPLPTPHTKEPYDFSFSGMKTAVLNLINNLSQKGEEINVPVMCATLRDKVTDILVSKTLACADEKGYKKIVMAGGVSANSALRSKMEDACKEKGYELYFPPLSLCGDNAAMVGAQAIYEFEAGHIGDTSLNAYATKDIKEG